jgi:hypothetical protein
MPLTAIVTVGSWLLWLAALSRTVCGGGRGRSRRDGSSE